MILNSEKIKVYLAKNMMSTKELSDKSGVSIKTLWGILKKNKKIRPRTAGKIAKALNCKVEDILRGEDI